MPYEMMTQRGESIFRKLLRQHPFVVSRDNRCGVGKLKTVEGDNAVVEYFRSPADDELISETVSRGSLTTRI